MSKIFGLFCVVLSVWMVQADELDDLISQMTIREKIGQLKQATLYTRTDVDQFLPLVRRGEVGSFIFNETLKREWRDELQRAALESRLKIPLSFADNIIHGWWTNFPIPLGLACSFEPELFEKMAHYGAIEGRQAGLDWTFGPMCDTARDPRWGRVSEGTGEDPWLNGVYAVAQVRGFQGDDASKEDRVAACLKHYCGYSSSTGGHDYNDSDFGPWTLRNLHLPPFSAAVKAGALSLMSGFNTYDGVPVLASREIMSDILRGEWDFNRLVVTDYKSVAQTMTWGVTANEVEAARRCLEVGNDIEMVSTTYDSLEAEVAAGGLDVKVVDQSVKRVLAFKRAVGLFKRPMSVPKPSGDALRRQTEKMQAFAKECALKSAVLLKNNGVLPLKSTVRKIALIGPVATDRRTMVGCWPGMESNDPQTPESLADALKRELGDAVELKVVSGCAINVKPAMIKGDDGVPMLNRSAPPVDAAFDAESAIAAAKASDLVVFALGEARDWTGENASRSLLTLTGRQQELFDAVTASVPNKPVVTIVACGRPLALPTVSERSSALFYAFHGGDGCPAALAELLTGKASPSGRLTISVPFDVSLVPVYYNSYTTGRPTYGHYLDTPERGALYPFGFGLTYSKFEYSAPQVEGRTVKATIKNVGTREATETVQLYVRQRACAEGARPKCELRGFQRVTLKPGQAQEVVFALTSEVLGYVDRKGAQRCDAGVYDLWIAPDSSEAARSRAAQVVIEGSARMSATGDYRLPEKAFVVAEEKGYNSWPMIQAKGTKLICSYSRDSACPKDGHGIGPGTRDSYLRVSSDGGRTWSPETVVAADPNVGEVNEGIGLDSSGAVLLWVRCWGKNRRHELYRTTDGVMIEKIATLVPDPFPMQVTDPVHVSGLGLVSPWFAGDYRKDGANSWGLLISTDEGRTWTQRVIESGLSVKEWVTEPSLVDLGNARLLIIGRSERNLGPQFQVTSADSGKTWKKSRTNIGDVAESTPSLVYDSQTGLLANYYYHRGARKLKRRVVAADFIFDRPDAWPEPEVLDRGFEVRAYDAGNVNVTRFANTDFCAWYSGTPSNATVVVTVTRVH